jgi:hypothetical protein
MDITIKHEGVELTIKNEDVETWIEAVEMFIDGLRGLGFSPKGFEYSGHEIRSTE